MLLGMRENRKFDQNHAKVKQSSFQKCIQKSTKDHQRKNYGKCIESDLKWHQKGIQNHRKSIKNTSPKIMENCTPEKAIRPSMDRGGSD